MKRNFAVDRKYPVDKMMHRTIKKETNCFRNLIIRFPILELLTAGYIQ